MWELYSSPATRPSGAVIGSFPAAAPPRYVQLTRACMAAPGARPPFSRLLPRLQAMLEQQADKMVPP
jgi:hypothetical protein